MKYTLLLDTSDKYLTVGVALDDEVIYSTSFEAWQRQSEFLVVEIKKAIEGDGRSLPNNFEAEQAVLGCALIDSEAALAVVSKLEEIDFYNETHRHIFKVVKDWLGL